MSGEDKLAAAFVVVFTVLVLGGIRWLKRGKSPDAMRALSQRILQNRYPYALLGSGSVIALLGVGMFVHASLIEAHALDLAALEAGGEVDAAFVEFQGFARPDARFCRSVRRGTQCYTPVFAAEDSTRVAVLLSGDAPPGPGRLSGFISRSNQLSVRRQAEAAGLATAPDLVRVIAESRTDRANAGAYVSLGGLGLFCFGWAWLRRARSAA